MGWGKMGQRLGGVGRRRRVGLLVWGGGGLPFLNCPPSVAKFVSAVRPSGQLASEECQRRKRQGPGPSDFG